jgi:hypothetical protein
MEALLEDSAFAVGGREQIYANTQRRIAENSPVDGPLLA